MQSASSISDIRRYPHEFSGGQRQRIGIARTLALRPEFIVCDEPISALDVSIQAQVINLLEKLQREKGFSYLFIAHDLEMVHHISHKIGVMYLGNMVELGSSDDVYKKPLHPYTRALISAAPIADPKMAKEKKRIILEGEVPSPINPPKGCPFAGRCKYASVGDVRGFCHAQPDVVMGSDFAVSGATEIARFFGMSERFIGLTIVAFGTSLPELVTSVTAARKGNAGIAIGNIVGSNIFNILFVIGTAALICSVPFERKFIIDTIIAVLSGVLLWGGTIKKKELRKPCGILMLLGYAAYFVYLCVI